MSQPTLQAQLLAILEQDDDLQITCADETGIYYAYSGNFGYIEPSEYQALIDIRTNHAPIAPNSGGNLYKCGANYAHG